jgi:hypothetical protein
VGGVVVVLLVVAGILGATENKTKTISLAEATSTTTADTQAPVITDPPTTSPPAPDPPVTDPPVTDPPVTDPPVTDPPAPAGPTLTQQQQSALEEANQYLSSQAFSQQGLIDQLDSAAGSGYSVNDATVAVHSLTVNWNAEAVQAAKEYLASEPFSCLDLVQQLDSAAGSGFTVSQATYGAQQAENC